MDVDGVGTESRRLFYGIDCLEQQMERLCFIIAWAEKNLGMPSNDEYQSSQFSSNPLPARRPAYSVYSCN